MSAIVPAYRLDIGLVQHAANIPFIDVGRVIQRMLELVLPPAASGLATGEWQSATELLVEIETQPSSIRGIIPIGGLSAALRLLSPLCAAK
jgi:hypothetical protein